jgi:hypothetical protein
MASSTPSASADIDAPSATCGGPGGQRNPARCRRVWEGRHQTQGSSGGVVTGLRTPLGLQIAVG